MDGVGRWSRMAASALGRARGGRRAPASEDARTVTAQQLMEAMRDGEIVVHYQPVVATEDGRIVGLEALVRWDQPERGVRRPSAFIGLLRDPEVAQPFGEFVLRSACEFVAGLQSDVPGIWLTVNASRAELLGGTLPDTVRGILEESGLAPSLLEIEVAEEEILGDEAEVLRALTALRAVGVRLGVDGVGTDQSSVDNVRRLPIDSVKIDLRLAARADAVRETLVEAAEAARERGLTVTAKWAQHPKRMAEDPAEQQLFDALRADYVQSYAYGEPAPRATILKTLATATPHPVPAAPRPPAEPVAEVPEAAPEALTPDPSPPSGRGESEGEAEAQVEAVSVPHSEPEPEEHVAVPTPPAPRSAPRPARVTSLMVRLEDVRSPAELERVVAKLAGRPEVHAASLLSEDDEGCWIWLTGHDSGALLAVVEALAMPGGARGDPPSA